MRPETLSNADDGRELMDVSARTAKNGLRFEAFRGNSIPNNINTAVRKYQPV